MLRFFSKNTDRKLSNERVRRLKELSRRLGVGIHDFDNLDRALTHTSALEKSAPLEETYERLEFLGDSILNASVAQILYLSNPGLSEGGLSALRSSVVDERTLAEVGHTLGVLDFVNLGKGETLSDSRAREKVTADIMESIIAVIFLEKGFPRAQKFVKKILGAEIEQRLKNGTRDFKTQVQKWSVSKFREYPQYEVIQEYGPDHNKIFEVRVTVHGRFTATGKGRTKKDAEQHAAEQVLQSIKKVYRKDRLTGGGI